MVALARNVGTRRADIVAGRPVCGLRPTRSALARIENAPKFAIFTSSPRFNDSEISPNMISTRRSAVVIGNPNLARIWLAKSDFFIVAMARLYPDQRGAPCQPAAKRGIHHQVAALYYFLVHRVAHRQKSRRGRRIRMLVHQRDDFIHRKSQPLGA